MVVRSPTDPEGAPDRVLRALADPTRRDIVRRSLRGEHSVTALAGSYPMSFAAVQKHVAVLERAGLVTKRRCGREQLVRGDVAALRTAHRCLDELEAVWRQRLDRLGDVLAGDEPRAGDETPADPDLPKHPDPEGATP